MRFRHLRRVNEILGVPEIAALRKDCATQQLTLDGAGMLAHIGHVAVQQAAGQTGRPELFREDMT